MIEGFHRAFRTRVNRGSGSVQEYFIAIRQQQILTDFHLDRLEDGITPAIKKRKNTNVELQDICKEFSEHYENIIIYLYPHRDTGHLFRCVVLSSKYSLLCDYVFDSLLYL